MLLPGVCGLGVDGLYVSCVRPEGGSPPPGPAAELPVSKKGSRQDD